MTNAVTTIDMNCSTSTQQH